MLIQLGQHLGHQVPKQIGWLAKQLAIVVWAQGSNQHAQTRLDGI